MSTHRPETATFAPRRRSSIPRLVALLALGAGLWTQGAEASPVLYAGTGQERVHSTQVSIIQKDGMTAMSIMPDYQGPLVPFAVIVPVPGDVRPADVKTIKREFMTRLEQVSAPRFAEFWEQDPCDPGPAQQTWERDMRASDASAFLGVVKTDPSTKVAKELLLDVEAKEKDGEYLGLQVSDAQALLAWIKKNNLTLPEGGDVSISQYSDAGFKFLYTMVDVNRMELIGGDRATLSPLRFFTHSEYSAVPARFGLPSLAKAHELLIFTLVPEQRMQVSNYPTKPIPTNLTVDFAVKERMGELIAALHDKLLERNPETFLLEYAYSTADCGKPCPTEPVLPHELLSLGGEAFEALLPKGVVRPEPPEPTAEELGKLEGLFVDKKPPEKREIKEQWEKDRQELAARKALIARQTYVLSRLHYRYGRDHLPRDPEFVKGAAISGGIDLPKGPEGAADLKVTKAEENTFQTRFNNMHPDISVLKCDQPERYKWGKPPRTYRGSSKIWIAEDLARKDRKQIDPALNVLTPVPELGLPGRSIAPAPVASAEPAPAEKKDEGCGCRVAGAPGPAGLGALGLALGALGLGALRLRRRSGA